MSLPIKSLKSLLIFQKKFNNTITSNDHVIINKLDVLLTKGMIKVERMIKKYGLQFPWSPTLAISIIELTIWKLIKSVLTTNTSRDTKIQKITNRLHKLDNSYTTNITNYELKIMKIINKDIIKAIKNLKKIQKITQYSRRLLE